MVSAQQWLFTTSMMVTLALASSMALLGMAELHSNLDTLALTVLYAVMLGLKQRCLHRSRGAIS